jgi:hypothetical protein
VARTGAPSWEAAARMTAAFVLSPPVSGSGQRMTLQTPSRPETPYTVVVDQYSVDRVQRWVVQHVTASNEYDLEELRLIVGYEKLARQRKTPKEQAEEAMRRARRDRIRALRLV